MIAGQIEIQMLADLAQLRQDMDKAVGFVGSATNKIESLIGGASKVLGGLGLGLSVGAIMAWSEKVIDAAGSLHDLATRTGSAVEQLSLFQEIGRTSGTTADAIAGAMDKLAKNTALVDDEGKLAALAIKAIGIDFDVFKRMKPDEQMMAVAKAMDEYEDGASKAAVAQALLGKEGSKLLPFLKDLARDTDTTAKVTKQQAENADAVADKFIAWKANAQGVAASYVLDLLPALDKMTGLIVPLVTTTGLYFALFVGAPAVFGAAKLAFDAAMLSLSGLGVAAAGATTSMGLLTAAAGVLVAAFGGWQIGTWLRENFLEASLAGIAFVEGSLLAWERIKLAAQMAWAVIESAWGNTLSGMGGLMSTFLQGLAGGLSSLGLDAAAEKMLAWSGKVKDATGYSGDLAAKLGGLKGDYERNRDAVKDVTTAMADDAIQAFKSREEHDKSGKSAKELAEKVDAARKALKDKEEQDKRAEAAAKANKLEIEKQDKAYKDLTEKVQAQILKMQAEEEQGAKLSEAQKLAMEVTKAVKDGVGNMTAARQADIEKMAAHMLQMDAAKEATKREEAAIKATKEERQRATDEVWKHAEQLDKEARKIEDENTVIGLTKQQLDALRLQRLEEETRVAQAIVDKDKLIGYCSDETAAHEATLEALKNLHKATEDKIYLQAANAASEAWKKSAEQIEQSLTDSLFRAFESGKGFWSTLWSGIVNTFKTTILQPIIKDVLSPFAQAWRSIASQISNTVLTPMISAVTSGLGLGSYTGPAQAGGTGGGSSLASTASSIGSLFPAVGGWMSSAGAAVSGWLSGTAIGASSASAAGAGALATNAALIESAAAASAGTAAAGSTLMASIGAAAPYIAAAIAIVTLLSKKRGGAKTTGGFNSADFSGLAVDTGLDGNTMGGDVASLVGGVQSTYAGIAEALGGKAGKFGGAAFISQDPKGTALTQFVLDATLNGKEIYSRNNRSTGGNVEDVARDPAALAAAIDTASQQAVLRALQETNITPEIDAMIDAISASMTGDQIKSELAKVLQYKQGLDAAAAAANPQPVGADGSGSGVGSGADYFSGVSSVQATSMVDSLASIDTKLDAMQKLVDGQAEQSNDQRSGQTAMVSAINSLLQILDNLTEGGNQLRVTDPTAQPVLTNALVELIALREKLFSVIDSSNRVMTIETP